MFPHLSGDFTSTVEYATSNSKEESIKWNNSGVSLKWDLKTQLNTNKNPTSPLSLYCHKDRQHGKYVLEDFSSATVPLMSKTQAFSGDESCIHEIEISAAESSNLQHKTSRITPSSIESFNRIQLICLENVYVHSRNPGKRQIQHLSSVLCIPPYRVSNWIKRRRRIKNRPQKIAIKMFKNKISK